MTQETTTAQDEFLSKVDTSWYYLTKGELWITSDYGDDRDDNLVDLIGRLRGVAIDSAHAFDVAMSDDQIAERIAKALLEVLDFADVDPA